MNDNFQTVLQLYRQGQFAAAERGVQGILATVPGHTDALQLAGLIAMQDARPADALDLWRRSLRIDPQQPAVLLNMASAELHLDRPQAALEYCKMALVLRPGYVEAWTNRGRALQRLARSDDALASYGEALRLKPDDWAIRRERAHLLMAISRPLDALLDYERVCQAMPRDPLAHFNRGLALEMARRFEAAEAAFVAALAHAPDFGPAHQHRGKVLRELGRYAQAFESHTRAIAAAGADPVDALCAAGDSLRDLGRLEDALAYYDRALALNPQHLDALTNRGRALLGLRRAAAAVKCFERAFELAPKDARCRNYGLGFLLHARLCCCDWRDYEQTLAQITEAVLAGERVTLPSLCLVSSDQSAAQLSCARRFVVDNWDALETPWPSTAPQTPTPAGPRRKLRVAYVSADFRQHPVASLLVSLIETHDRERFEILGISLRPADGTALGQRIRGAFDRCIDIHGMSDTVAVELLRGLDIDIAVDLNGYTDGFRAALFARRIAPIQINFLGYAGTLGATHMDYVMADSIVIPAQEQEYFTEQLVHLPGSFFPGDARRPLVSQRLSRTEAGLPERGFVFCCFNNHYKLNPRMFDAWMRMLDSVEGSVLWLAGAAEPIAGNLRSEAVRRGIAPERLLFAPRLADHGAHLARIAAADLFLDTLPFNAHTTAAEALWAGLPVLTCRGKTMAGRVGASLVSAAGLPELATKTMEAYEALGISLAQSPQAMTSMREKLRAQRPTASLYDHAAYRHALEAAYERMHAQTRWRSATEDLRG